MLILTRRPTEEIFIGQAINIRIKIVRIRGNQVRLGIEAPKGTYIKRAELALPEKRKILRGRFSGSDRSKEKRQLDNEALKTLTRLKRYKTKLTENKYVSEKHYTELAEKNH